MAGVTITCELAELLRATGRAVQAGRDMKPAFQLCGEHMLRSIRANFEAGGRPQPWMPLSGSTLIRRVGGTRKAFTKKGKWTSRMKKEMAGHKILIWSGRLLNSITYAAHRDSVEIGSNLVYAATHQFGRGRIPARHYLAIQPEDEVVMAGIIERHLLQGFR